MNRERGNYYLESEPGSWAWALGDGIAGGAVCYAAPRQIFRGDPAASLTLGEMLPDGLIKAAQFANSRWPEKRATYERLAARVGTVGLFIHAPEKRCSAAEFAYRAEKNGVAQPVSRTAATGAARRLPLTAIFTHRRQPVFQDDYHRRGALALAEELLATTGSLDATWLRPAWGLEAEEDRGDDHYLRAVLRVIERLDWEWPSFLAGREPWQRARRFFKATPLAEQPIGAARITRVVYARRGDEPEAQLEATAAAGIEVVEVEGELCTQS